MPESYFWERRLALLPHSSIVPGSVLRSGYCLCGDSHFHLMPVWVSSGLSGFLHFPLKTFWLVDWLLGMSVWMYVHGDVWSMKVYSYFIHGVSRVQTISNMLIGANCFNQSLTLEFVFEFSFACICTSGPSFSQNLAEHHNQQHLFPICSVAEGWVLHLVAKKYSLLYL